MGKKQLPSFTVAAVMNTGWISDEIKHINLRQNMEEWKCDPICNTSYY